MATNLRGLRAGALALIGGVALLFSATSAQAQCVGDCNDDGMVAINELIIGVNIALGAQPVSACPSFDANDNGEVAINELISAVNNALNGCPAPVDTPTATETAVGDTPTATETAADDTPTPTEPIIVNTPTATDTVAADTPTPTDTVAAETPTASPTPTETSAPALGNQTCTLNSEAGQSTLLLQTQAFPLPAFPAAGTIGIDCGAPGADGVAACDCAVQAFDTVVIPGIGDICVNPFPGCPSGAIDCDGGGANDVNLVVDHNIGSCTNNAECLADCDAECATLGATYDRLLAGCEGFCQGGSNDEATCLRDSECPGGNCVGGEPVAHIGVCNCSCGGDQLGSGSPAGALSCNVGTQIDVELPSDGDCLDPNTIVLAGVCGGVTTTMASGQILDVNNNPGTNTPPQPKIMNGAGGTCAAFAEGNLTGLKLVGELGFFDSTLGDILSQNTFVCQ